MSLEELEQEVSKPQKTSEAKKTEQTEELTKKLEELTVDNPELMRQVCSDFVKKFQEFREEDQELIIRYLEQTLMVMRDFTTKYSRDLEAQARQRDKEAVFLDLATRVLNRYL
jgi:dsDNA-specific endonuclease/ATPase MutS2